MEIVCEILKNSQLSSLSNLPGKATAIEAKIRDKFAERDANAPNLWQYNKDLWHNCHEGLGVPSGKLT